jgi:hypothetical protein
VAVRAGLPLRETDRSSAREPPEGSAPRTDFFSAIDTLLAQASSGDDESFQHLVDRVDVDGATKAHGLGLVEGYHAADPAKISVQALLDSTAVDEGPGPERQFRFVRGYDGLVTALFDRAVRELFALALETLGETERVGTALEALGAAVGVDASWLRGSSVVASATTGRAIRSRAARTATRARAGAARAPSWQRRSIRRFFSRARPRSPTDATRRSTAPSRAGSGRRRRCLDDPKELSSQERAAVLLEDARDLSLEEIATYGG